MRIGGLFLYRVRIRYDKPRDNYPKEWERVGTSLWITTPKFSISDASRKAEKFLDRRRRMYRNAKIGAVEEEGTLDA